MKKLSCRFTAVSAAVLSLCLAGAAAAADEKAAEPAELKEAQKPAEAPKGADADKATAGESNEAKKELSPNEPAAVVNGRPIPKSEYDRALNAYLISLSQYGGGPGQAGNAGDALKEEVVTQLVDRELLYQESSKNPPEDLQKEIDSAMQSIRATERFEGSEEKFQEALKEQSLTEKDLRDLLGRQISVQHYVKKVIEPAAVVADEEVKKFYEENKARFATPEQVSASHLLIRIPEGAKLGDEEHSKARAKAEGLQKRAAAGEDFAKLCAEHSEDPGSKDNGGELGFFSRDRVVEPFASAAFALKVNGVSEVVETRFGFHVIKLLDRKDAVQASLDEVKEDILAYLKGQALDRAVRAKIEELRKGAKIEVSPRL